jgi:UDP-glucosyltransferase BX8/BX9
VPMICRPCFGDQLGAARYVCHMWRVGVELEVGTRLQRWNVEAATEKLMDGTEGKEVRVRTKDLNESTDECINERGSSYTALLGLVDLMLSF